MNIDPKTIGLLAASAGFLDPRGGMMGGIASGLGAYAAANQMKSAQATQEMNQRKLLRQLQLENYLQELTAKHGNDPASLSKALMSSPYPEAMKMGIDLSKANQVHSFLQTKDASGNPVYRPAFKTGEVGEAVAPILEKLAFQNLGNQTVALDPYTGKPVTSYAQSMSPGESARLSQAERHFGASHSLAQQNAALNQYKAFMPQYRDGMFISPPKPGESTPQITETPYFSPAKGSQAEKTKLSSKVQDILGSDTRDLIKQSTSSGLGVVRDFALGTVGAAMDSAKVAQKLKMRAATLAGNMPRFEGPQSDADREYYQAMAGNIGDASLPVSIRLSAVDELERMYKLAGPDGVVNTEELRKSGLRSGQDIGGFKIERLD